MLRGNIYSPDVSTDTQVLREVIKGGNLPAKEKKKAERLVKSIEKEEEKEKKPALDLRAMYGNN